MPQQIPASLFISRLLRYPLRPDASISRLLPSSASLLLLVLAAIASIHPAVGLAWHDIDHDPMFTQLSPVDDMLLQLDTLHTHAILRARAHDWRSSSADSGLTLHLGSIFIQANANYSKLARHSSMSSLISVVFCFSPANQPNAAGPRANISVAPSTYSCLKAPLPAQRWQQLSNSSYSNRVQTEFELTLPFSRSLRQSHEDALYAFHVFVEMHDVSEAGRLRFAVSPLRFFIVAASRGCTSDSDTHQIGDPTCPQTTSTGIASSVSMPFLSIIFTGTNDSPSFLRRVCLMLSSLTQMIHANNISAEIIVVDWASLAKFPPFGDQIAQRCVLFRPVRVVVVPTQMHLELHSEYSEQYPHLREAIDAIGVYSEAAKNVGARRSRGEFLVFINGDTIISPALLLRLQPATLKKGYVYRAARWELDVMAQHHVDSGLSYDLVDAFKRFHRECNIAQGTRFIHLGNACKNVCMPAGHCFGFDPRHECLAADAGANASSFCPSPDGFEEFCNVGTVPDHNDSVLFADASGTPPQYASAAQLNAGVTVVAGDFIAVNSFEFREMRGFVEMPQNVHADTLGLYKLVAIVCICVALVFWCL
jgi:hypothetical protein